MPLSAFAADVNGTWKAEFETQRGLQKYTFTLKQDGAKVTGKVNVDTGGEKREVELKDGKIEGESVTFAEPLSIQGNDILITFTGKISDSGIKFTRQVGDFGSSEAAAKRDAVTAPAPAASTEPAPAAVRVAAVGAADLAVRSLRARTTKKPFPRRRKASTSRATASSTASSNGLITTRRPSA